jgi:hypothetical protein
MPGGIKIPAATTSAFGNATSAVSSAFSKVGQGLGSLWNSCTKTLSNAMSECSRYLSERGGGTVKQAAGKAAEFVQTKYGEIAEFARNLSIAQVRNTIVSWASTLVKLVKAHPIAAGIIVFAFVVIPTIREYRAEHRGEGFSWKTIPAVIVLTVLRPVILTYRIAARVLSEITGGAEVDRIRTQKELKEKDAEIAAKDAEIAAKDNAIAAKDAEIEAIQGRAQEELNRLKGLINTNIAGLTELNDQVALVNSTAIFFDFNPNGVEQSTFDAAYARIDATLQEKISTARSQLRKTALSDIRNQLGQYKTEWTRLIEASEWKSIYLDDPENLATAPDDAGA